MESSATREYPSLIHTFFLTHTVGDVFLNPADKALYDEMLRLQGLGSNTSTGVSYTEYEIMAIVHEGKQRGHIPDVGVTISFPRCLRSLSHNMSTVVAGAGMMSREMMRTATRMRRRCWAVPRKNCRPIPGDMSPGINKTKSLLQEYPGRHVIGENKTKNIAGLSRETCRPGKFYDVPINVFTKDGLSAITTKLGTSLMLDSYTTAMCTDSWGRASYARAMVELRTDVELRDTIMVDVLIFIGEGLTKRTIHVEYEWTPPRCSSCQVFGHVLDECPKKIISDVLKNSKMSRKPDRVPTMGLKTKSTFVYRLISTKKEIKANGNPKVQTANKATTTTLISFETLSTLVDEEEGGVINESKSDVEGDQGVESDEDKVEMPDDEMSRYIALNGRGGLLKDDLDCYDG
ncbi:hypothetical protein Tco_1368766, partial [Tanacetum coccineum]